jgi:hypothetical protein
MKRLDVIILISGMNSLLMMEFFLKQIYKESLFKCYSVFANCFLDEIVAEISQECLECICKVWYVFASDVINKRKSFCKHVILVKDFIIMRNEVRFIESRMEL